MNKIKMIAKRLEKQLNEYNEKFETDNNAYDNLKEEFTVTVDNVKISLASMDTYEKLCSFLECAATDYDIDTNDDF
jgi:hypothetical protein